MFCLAYYNLLDDWQDERRISRYAAAQLLSKQYEAIKAKYQTAQGSGGLYESPCPVRKETLR